MDVVITYVDDTEGLRKEYAQYCKKEFQENRFRSYGVLDLQVRGIRKYMPYVKNIFIVVNYKIQVKDYDFTGLDVTIVEHRKIIPKLFLPCFNSCTIEMFLYNIPGLDEEFIYFNDDCFVIDEIPYEHWFKGGKPCIYPTIHTINKSETNTYKKNLYNSTNLICSLFSNGLYASGKYITQEHCPRPFLKSTYKEVWKEAGNEIKKSLTRLRNSKNYNATLFNDYDFINNNYYEFSHNYGYFNLYEDIYEICNFIDKRQKSIICINDNGEYFNFNKFKNEFRKSLNINVFEQEYLSNKKSDDKNKSDVKLNIKEKIELTDNLYISFTSLSRKINNCKHTIDLMMNQTMKPTKIILNLTEEEFPNKEYDLPKDILVEIIKNSLFEIYWIKEHTTVWNNIIPTMNRYSNDLVLSIDNDIEYPSNYIEEMYRTYCKNDKQYPVVCYEFKIDGNLCHSNSFTLTSKKFYGTLLDDIYNEIILPTLPKKNWDSDIVYYKVLNSLGYKYVKCYDIDGNSLYNDYKLNKESKRLICVKENEDEENIKLIDSFIMNKFSKLMKVSLCAIAKNENRYIREWVEWYKKIGISKIFIYDNNDINGEKFEDVINDYINDGFVEIVNRRGIIKTVNTDQDGQTLQGLSFQDCYDKHYNEYDWMCFFDIDEFLEMSKGYNLYTFLNLFANNPCDGIHVQWRMYGDNNLLYYDNRSVFERFYNKKNESPSTLIKTILKGKEHHKDNLLFCAHGPLKISGKYKQIDIINADFSQAFNPYRNLHDLNPNMGAYLDHFYCKSTEEFINRKWKKASAVTGINMNRNYDIDFLMDQYFKHTKRTEAKVQLFNNLINEKQHIEKVDKNDRIIVNFTTWTKRDTYVPILLKYFQNQTLHPDEIICWLSEDEYHGIIPPSIQYCLDNNLLTDVKFVSGNIYGHKRYETFKYNMDAYNILIDDDLYYPIDYVELLYKECKKHSNDVICYYSRHEIYKHNGVRGFTDADKDASFGNRYFSGLAAFPPNIFPIESFKYPKLRDKYCQKCDDSWINGWLFKKNIKVRAIKNWGKYSPLNVIGSTQDDGIYETHNGLKINGIMQASINIANAIVVTHTENIASKLWPEFNINSITTCNKRI